jgi:hypothetical protein
MTMHRRFSYTATATRFTINEIEPTRDHPLRWLSIQGIVTHQGAWDVARSQAAPVTVYTRDGFKDLGVVFDPAVFEQVMYQGYVGYGQSMSDGLYIPLTFEAWVAGFRSHPDTDYNDAPVWVKAALPVYVELLRAARALGRHALKRTK